MILLHPNPIMGTFNACRTLSLQEVEELERLSIPPDALAAPIPVAASDVYFDGNRFAFEHHHHHYGEKGVRAFMFLITNPWDEAIDIVAWSPSLNKLAAWLGRAWALGEETIFRARLTDHRALPVHRSPIGWLKARRHGISLVRPAAAVHYLDDAEPLLAEDAAHGAELSQILTRPAPRILVPASPVKKVA
jgi:hypothetical protein